MIAERPLETFITLVLEHVDAELAAAHRELYPERVAEHIPLSLTLLYPWIPAASVTRRDLDELRSFFAGRPPLDFELVRLAEIPGKVLYAVPQPDDELRATMRALCAKYPEYPPYRVPGSAPRRTARSVAWKAITPSRWSRWPLGSAPCSRFAASWTRPR
jgi:hypothetical protein